MESPQII